MKIQSPWMGRIKGSAGNMTGCKVYDKNVMRAKAFEVNNPNTAAQKVQRGYFADLTKLVASFTPDQLRTLFPSKPKAMSRRNALSKQLAEYNSMDGTTKVIDFNSIDTLGNAPTMDFGLFDTVASENNITFSLDTFATIHPEYIENLFVVVLINTTKKEMTFPSLSQIVGSIDLDIPYPTGWGTEDVILGIPFITNIKGNASQLPDFGSFIIKVRPEKKSN
jgi:hypothetical protein